MTLFLVEGDLLKSDCTIILHQCNCFGKMGAGLAKQIAKIYPEAYLADKSEIVHSIGNKSRLGDYSFAVTKNVNTGETLLIFNVYGQYNYGRGLQTSYGALTLALDGAFSSIEIASLEKVKIGVPYKMGCDRAGGEWDIVSEILELISRKYDLDIYIYKI